MRTSPTLATLALAIAVAAPLSACVVADDAPADDELGELGDDELTDDDVVVQERRILNGMEPDDFWNPVIQSESAMQKLRELSIDAIAADPEFRPLMATMQSRRFMTKLLYCALPSGTQIEFPTMSGGTYAFIGMLGLAPDWRHRALTVEERRLISGCVLGLVNAYGRYVIVDMRGEPAHRFTSSYSSDLERFYFEEASFYGDIFYPNTRAVWERLEDNNADLPTPVQLFPEMSACWNETYLRGRQYVDGRICGQTVCVAKPVGACQDVCQTQDGPEVLGNGDNNHCWNGRYRFNGTRIERVHVEQVVTTFLTQPCLVSGTDFRCHTAPF